MKESDRQELASLRRQHHRLTEDLAALGRRLEYFEARVGSSTPAPGEALRAEPLSINPLPLDSASGEPGVAGTPARIEPPRRPSPEVPALDAWFKQDAGAAPVSEPTRGVEEGGGGTPAGPLEIPPVIGTVPAGLAAPLQVERGACEHCGGRIEYTADSAGSTLICPHCRLSTRLATLGGQAEGAVAESEPPGGESAAKAAMDETVPAVEGAPVAEPALAESASLELRLGTYWMVRVGVVMLLTTLGLAGYYAYKHYVPQLGPWGKVLLLYLASGTLLGVGGWLQRREGRASLRNYGQVMLAGGLAAVYFTTYAAHHIPALRIIGSALLDGALLLGWAGFIVWLADRRKSEVLALFAIGLAWYTSLVTNVGLFTLYSNLLLTVAAVVFLVRNQWAALSFASLVATYGGYGYWRFYQNGVWLFDLGASPERLWHGVTLLAGYWAAFTAAVFLSRAESLSGGRRLSFLSFNNGAFFGLTVASMYSSHAAHFWQFCLSLGSVLVLLGWAARRRLPEEPTVSGGYVTQGVLLITVGLIAKFTGMQLALMLGVESVTLLLLGHWRQNRWLIYGAHVVGALAVGWGIDGTRREDGTSVLLGAVLGGFLAFNAFWAARQAEPEEHLPLRLSPGFFSALALIMWLVATWAYVPGVRLAPVLALEAVALTASIYLLRTRELMLLGQIPLLLAQGMWLVDALSAGGSAGDRPWWNPVVVLGVSVGLGHWWQRQRSVVLVGDIGRVVRMIYSAAAVGVLYYWLKPLCQEEAWLAASAGLGVVVTAYGLATRAWPLAVCGQVFMVVSAGVFVRLLVQGHPGWGYALAPMAALLLVAGAVVPFCARREELAASQPAVQQVGVLYRLVAVLMAVAWVHEYIPAAHRVWVLIAAGAAVFGFNQWRRDQEGIVLGGVLSAAGWATFVFLTERPWTFDVPTLLALVVLLGQQQALRRGGAWLAWPAKVGEGVIALGGFAVWLWVTRGVVEATEVSRLSLAWSILAVLFAGAGLGLRERMYGWLNLACLGAGLGYFGLLVLSDEPAERVTYWGHLVPIAILLLEQQLVRRHPARLPFPESGHTTAMVVGGGALWLFVTRAIQIQSSGFLLTVGWTALGFTLLVAGFALRERVHRWMGLGLLGLALARVAIYDFWKLDTLYQILSALALGTSLVVLGFIYNRYQDTLRKWL